MLVLLASPDQIKLHYRRLWVNRTIYAQQRTQRNIQQTHQTRVYRSQKKQIEQIEQTKGKGISVWSALFAKFLVERLDQVEIHGKLKGRAHRS